MASFRAAAPPETAAWSPKIGVFENNDRLVTRVDLPGMKKDDVSVDVTDGHLALSGERKREAEEKKGTFYRSEREYGRFCRSSRYGTPVLSVRDGAEACHRRQPGRG
jgi:HSP20 family protein